MGLLVVSSFIFVAVAAIGAPPAPDYDHDDDDSLMIPGCSAGSRWTLYRSTTATLCRTYGVNGRARS